MAAQANLSLHLSQRQIVGNLMLRLNYIEQVRMKLSDARLAKNFFQQVFLVLP